MAIDKENELVLVTGASGFIATHCVQQLLNEGYRVRGTVRSLKDEKKTGPLKRLSKNAKHEIELVEADLNNEASWINALKGCTYVLHTASPFPLESPRNEDDLIKPAVNGTLSVLKACVQEGNKIKRVVLTSSVAAIIGDNFENGKTYSENNWTDIKNAIPYTKSKYLAEKAAWNFIEDRKKNNQECFELATINPGFVMGPLIHDSPCSSTEIVKRLMLREMPMVPDVRMPACDVRDVALAHIRAMELPEAAGHRHMIVSEINLSSFLDWAKFLKNEFGSKNYNVPTSVAPNFLISLLSLFDKSVKPLKSLLGVTVTCDNSRFKNVLKIQPIEMEKTVVDMAYSLIERGVIPKRY